MSQICSFCGCPLESGCGLCPNCGAPVSGGDDFEQPLYGDASMEALSGEEYAAVYEPIAEPEPEPEPEPDPIPEPEPDPVPEPRPEPKAPPKPVPAPKPVSTPKPVSPPVTTSAPRITSTPPSYTPPAPAKPKKKRGCCGCGCGCFLPLLLVIALVAYALVSGIAGEIFQELGIEVDWSQLEALLEELPFELPFEITDAETVPQGDIPADAAQFNGHYYYIFTEPVDSLETAQAFCETRGGYLAAVTTTEESQFLYDYILQRGCTGNVYLGGTDADEEGNWRWFSGEPFEPFNWNDGEPNNYDDNEHVLTMHPDIAAGLWNDTAFAVPSRRYDNAIISGVEASSVLKNKSKYAPEAMLDNDLDTAWNEGADGITGESVTCYFDGVYELTGFEIRGGFQYSESVYFENARPSMVELSFSDGTLLYFDLEDVRDVQHIDFAMPVSAEWVALSVLDAYPGHTYDDLCITELAYHAGSTPVTGFVCEWGEPNLSE